MRANKTRPACYKNITHGDGFCAVSGKQALTGPVDDETSSGTAQRRASSR
jgi:hypothetical protein